MTAGVLDSHPDPPVEIGDGAWRLYAACQGVDPDLFYSGQGDNFTNQAARAVCATCPVKAPCLEYALVNVEKFGVWGGKSERERRRLRRERSGRPYTRKPAA
jgi:WhiB family redox-sensing transcriptional regulator